MGDKQRKLKDKASRAYADGDLKDALKLYERVVAEDPSELQCKLKLGDIHRKLGNFSAAVHEYAPVAKAYGEDGLLLKAIAVCKMILGVDAGHTETQVMLADLYAKRRGPAAPQPAPVTLEGMGISAPAGGQLPGQDYGMVEFDGSALEAPSLPDEASGAWRASEAVTDTPMKAAWPTPASKAPAWPSTSRPAQAPPAAQWPTSAPKAAQWPTPGASIEDSELDIVVGEAVDEEAPKVIVGEKLEDSVLDITVDPASLDDDAETSAQLASLLSELSEEGEDEPLEIETEDDAEEGVAIAFGTGAAEETWDGAIAVEDVDAPAASQDVIELTEPVEASISDIARPQIPLFSELPKNAFIELLVQMEMRELDAGEYVIREGETGDSFFVVASGRVRVARRGPDGRDVDLAILTDGAFFGEMALLQDGARTASVIVEQESQILEIKKEVLDSVVQQYPSVATVLRNFYRQRLLSTVMATHPIFSPFTPDERRDLMEKFKSKNFEAGEVLLAEGKKGTGLFILLYGSLEVAKTQGADTVVLATLGPGDMFGEMSLLTNQPTVASVTATSDCFVLRLSKKKFDELIMTHPQILELVALVSDERASLNDALMGDAQAFNAGAVLV